MNTAPPQAAGERAADHLLADCAKLAAVQRERVSALERLERRIGGELAEKLLRALVGDHRLRGALLV